MQRVVDAVVIGGGPAGSLAALLLARLGWRVVLAERGPRHRDKACGDCLNVRASGALERAGVLADVRRLAVGLTRKLRIHVERRRPVAATLPAYTAGQPGLLVDRARFDQLLIDRAAESGARVLQPAAARLVQPLGPSAAVHIRCKGSTLHLRSRLVVGADGIRSSVARHAGLAAPGTCGRKFGFAFDIPTCAGAGAIPPESIEMFVVAGGYLGVVRRGGDGLHVAGLIGGRTTRGSDPHAFVESVAGRFDILAEAGLDRLARLDRTRTLGAGPMPCRPRRVVGGPVALVGDAAGYVEPFTGEGMSWALDSAEILGRAVAGAAPGSWTPAAARRYARGWADRIGRRQRACTALGRALDRPVVSRALLAVAARQPALVNRLVRRAVLS